MDSDCFFLLCRLVNVWENVTLSWFRRHELTAPPMDILYKSLEDIIFIHRSLMNKSDGIHKYFL